SVKAPQLAIHFKWFLEKGVVMKPRYRVIEPCDGSKTRRVVFGESDGRGAAQHVKQWQKSGCRSEPYCAIPKSTNHVNRLRQIPLFNCGVNHVQPCKRRL